MQYRRFGSLDMQVSALGFGCMRLPKTQSGGIDEPVATRMLHYAIEHGVTYFDTAYGYHGGESERFLGRALADGYRQRVKIATKLPLWAVESASDFDRLLNEQLTRLQTDHVDFYLLHGIRKYRWDKVRDLGVLEWLDKAQTDGRIGKPGFSFHDTFSVFKDVIDSYNGWAMCQIQYNYMNEEFQAGTTGLLYAASKGLAVVIMEPLLGGRLVNPPPAVQRVWDTATQQRSPVEWALLWLWNKPEVSVVLSGMSTMQQVEDNIVYASRSRVGALSSADLEVIARARDAYRSLMAAPCTSCGYCMPCPNGVDIPRTFSILNDGLMFATIDDARTRYKNLMADQDESILASSCIQCSECEDKCPQGIPISDWMPYLDEVLGQGKPYDPAVVLLSRG